MRGEAEGGGLTPPEGRITPACAGRSFVSESETRTTWDHPRVCGEKAKRARKVHAPVGSPPRVRGEDDFPPVNKTENGITPACAGRSPVSPQGFPPSRDHPRVCGEKPHILTKRLRGGGSPPRVRGEVIGVKSPISIFRITPACAGRSMPANNAYAPKSDHPRVCGEKISASCWSKPAYGSPPRVRGEV